MSELPLRSWGGDHPLKSVPPGLPSHTVIVATHNRAPQLETCLGTLRRFYDDLDIVVVDSSPADGSRAAEELASRYRARYLCEAQPGLSRARNLGARGSTAEVVVFIDDDAVPEPNWLPALLEEFHDPEVVVVCGRVLPTRVETEAERKFASRGGFDSGPERVVLSRSIPNWFEMTNFVFWGGGANIAVRHSLFDRWPGFDERMGIGAMLPHFEEQHAIFNLVAAGFKHVYTPAAIVRHPFPAELGELRTRYRTTLRSAAAYAMLLFWEHREYRSDVVRLVYRRLLRRGSLHSDVELPPCALGRFEALAARLQGIGLYLKMLAARLSGTPSAR